MKDLMAAELRRVADRRMVRLTMLVIALLVVAGGVLTFARTAAISEADFEQRERRAETEQDALQARSERCLREHGVEDDDREVSASVADACFPDRFPTAHDPRFHRSRLKGLLEGTSGVLAVLAWAVGASLVGAEFSSRGVTTMLTWEPRRTRVFLAKAAAAIATTAAIAVVTLAGVVLVMLPSLAAHGAPLGSADPTWAGLAGLVARGTALAAMAGGIGFGLATIARNTAAALGVGFAYVIVLENILGTSLDQWRRWLLLGNLIVFLVGATDDADVPGRSVLGAGTFLLVVAIGVLGLAAATFRARDIG